jgi:hypothetical protein
MNRCSTVRISVRIGVRLETLIDKALRAIRTPITLIILIFLYR